ncbi:hypothetical protein KA005_81685 [bacterium]|nr:hypothetical protein [bacterium]
MKILAGIPTRRRSTAGKIADQIAPFVDKVIVVSQKAEVICKRDDIAVIEAPELGICAPRNLISDFAMKHDYDLLFQVDDDINFPDKVIKSIIHIAANYPNIGAISSDYRAGAHWNRELETSQDFRIHGVASQLWVVSVKALRSVTNLYDEPPFHIDALEDIRFSTKLWSLGYPVVRLHMGEKITHSPFVARLTKTNEQGGQYIEERNASMQLAIDEMQPFCGKDQVLRFLKVNDKDPDNLKYRIGYNYDEMTIRSVNKHGYMGYKDSKGRIF